MHRHWRAPNNLPHHGVRRGSPHRSGHFTLQFGQKFFRRLGKIATDALTGRSALEQGLGFAGTQNALSHHHQVFALRHPAGPTLLLGRMLIDIDKLRALQLLQRRRQCDQRHKDEYQCINRHAEQNRMHQRVQPLDAKKGLRAQPIETEQAKLNHCVREKHPPGKAWQKQCKKPDQKSTQQP